MPRNLDNRIEVITPVYDQAIKEEMKKIIDYGLRDTLQGRVVDGTGKNSSWTTDDNIPFRSQSALYDCYLEKNQE